jgi:hypothetical protein
LDDQRACGDDIHAQEHLERRVGSCGKVASLNDFTEKEDLCGDVTRRRRRGTGRCGYREAEANEKQIAVVVLDATNATDGYLADWLQIQAVG